MKNTALVVVAYNRTASISRILQSLGQADYLGMEVPLIISIDNSGSDEVASIARKFEWQHGEKIIIEHPERLGLRKHVLFCGNLTNDYDAVAVLEDDVFVSPHFYSFVCQTAEKYDSNDRVAGISLYTHLWSESANRPFIPQNNGYEAFFHQYAQSWGQVWTKGMWAKFYSWYLENDSEFGPEVDMPSNIASWPKSSWLKYYIRYVVKTNRYFVYPYVALSTNFTDPGTHNPYSNTSYQVPLLWHEKTEYKLPTFSDDSLRYDVFFETQGLGKVLGLPEGELCVDLYESKRNGEAKRYWLTTKQSEYKVLDSFALQLRPHELNIIADVKGNEIFLYDTSEKALPVTDKVKNNQVLQIRYDVRAISRDQLFTLLTHEIKNAFKRKLVMMRFKK